jgi:PAS domain S-box-containing protein
MEDNTRGSSKSNVSIRVLCLDDDPAGARLLQKRLLRNGFDVITEPDVPRGLNRLYQEPFDILITDHKMPGITGLEMVRNLQQQQRLPPTIMVTGLGNEAIAVEAMKLGVDDYIVKDLDGHYLELLPTVITEVLRRKRIRKEREELEAALRESEVWFRSVFESSLDAIFIIDENGNLTTTNQAAVTLSGYSQSELRRLHFHRLLPEDKLDEARMLFQQVLAGKPVSIERQLLRKDDALIDVSLSCTRLVMCDRVYANVVARDITERQRAQEALQHSERKYRQLVETMRDGMVVVDQEMIVRFVNESLCRILGKQRYELINKSLYAFTAEDNHAILDAQQRHRANGESGSYELCLLDMHGRRIKTLLSASPLEDRTGHYTGSLAVVTDITEYKEMQALAERQRQQLIQAAKMVALGTLVSGVAHEINNPNNNILLNSTLLLEAWESIQPVLDDYDREHEQFIVGGLPYEEMREDIPELFHGLYEGAQRIKRIVSDLKDFARQDVAEMDQIIDVNQVINSAVKLSSHMIKKSTMYFKKECCKLPSVCGNAQRLEQVLINLLQNACQALETREQGITICSRLDSETKKVNIEIRDEGRGIPEEMLERIMDPFFTTRRDQGGTGLGLSVSAGIVEEHEGSLHFSSAPGKGTTAVISLPVSAPGYSGDE